MDPVSHFSARHKLEFLGDYGHLGGYSDKPIDAQQDAVHVACALHTMILLSNLFSFYSSHSFVSSLGLAA